MKFLSLLFLLLLFQINPIHAQTGQFIELKGGSILEGKVEYQSKMFKSDRLILNDTTSIALSRVKAYQTSEGYFLRVNKGYGDDFAKRLEEGNINLYSRSVTSYGGGSWMPGPNGTQMYMGPSNITSQVEYFSKEGGPLLKANARNLKSALSDNPVSMDYLKKRDNLTAVQVIGIIGGVAIAGFAISNQVDKEEPDFTGVVLGGVILSGSSWLPHFAKKDMVKKAIKAYNNPESDF